ncbi:MAG TPA: ankyrin repeat domain-containing protein [Gammaproteobacteria bacterium]|nr:ankyrin repeat domain-containing protein [Gammaproteobacteria bacterium]
MEEGNINRNQVNARDQSGRTALHRAVLHDDKKQVETLLRNKADVTLRDTYGRIPLDYIERRDNSEIIELLRNAATRQLFEILQIGSDENKACRLVKCGADIYKPNPEMFNNTALHYAAKNGFLELATLLLHSGVKIESENAAGLTPLLEALFQGQEKMVTPLATALIEGGVTIYDDVKQTITSPIQVQQFLQDYVTRKLFDVLTNNGSETVACRLVELGADVQTTDDAKNTALHYAAKNSFIALAELLLDRGADINVVNKTGRPPLFEALLGKQDEMAAFLIRKGAAYIDIVDHEKLDAINIAAKNNLTESFKLLTAKPPNYSPRSPRM